jgi:DNA-binding transcriptional LysR family regulator
MDQLQGIQLFIRVVETGSFSKASTDLGITQPTATKHVAALEHRLGARLLHRSTRGVTPTEVGAAYYDKCLAIARALEEADNLAALQQSSVRGQLRISTSVAFGRRVMVPIVIDFMREHPELQIDLSFDDRYVNLVEQGVDVAIRMGQLADSSLGASYLGLNPWMVAASPDYLERQGTPTEPDELREHAALIYSTVQGDERWRFVGPTVRPCRCPFRGRCAPTTSPHCSPPRAPGWGSLPCPGTWRTPRWKAARSGRCSPTGRCRPRKSTPCFRRRAWCPRR